MASVRFPPIADIHEHGRMLVVLLISKFELEKGGGASGAAPPR
jgi:hypothetical protein